MRTLLSLTSAALLAAGCSGASAEIMKPTSHAKAGSTATAAAKAPPARVRRGTVRITPLGSYPPAERLPAFAAVKIADANYPAGLAAAPDGRILYSELWGGKIRVIRPNGTVDPEPWFDVN